MKLKYTNGPPKSGTLVFLSFRLKKTDSKPYFVRKNRFTVNNINIIVYIEI